MKSLTPAEKASTFDSFAQQASPSLTVLDRSTLERYAICPAQARFLETGAVKEHAEILTVGQEVHDALSHATSAWIDSRGQMSPSELRDELETWMRSARPDVQPQVIAALKMSVWEWARYVGARNYRDIMRFDGGEGDLSGQLARDIDSLGLRITSEIDLLHAGPSSVVLHEIDYKSGWKKHGVTDVRDSFQFQLHWWLLADNYPDCQALQVVVWDTRIGKRTWAVEFTREDLPAIAARINSAAGQWWHFRGQAPDTRMTWPVAEKCEACPAAHLCPVADHLGDHLSHENYVDWLAAAEARVAAVTKRLSEERKRRGADIVTAAGNAFGLGKPTKPRAASCKLYGVKSDEPTEESE